MLEHAAGQYDQVLCCGDIVGMVRIQTQHRKIREFNPNHSRNHEKVAWNGRSFSFQPLAKRAALWTQTSSPADNRNYLKQIHQAE